MPDIYGQLPPRRAPVSGPLRRGVVSTLIVRPPTQSRGHAEAASRRQAETRCTLYSLREAKCQETVNNVKLRRTTRHDELQRIAHLRDYASGKKKKTLQGLSALQRPNPSHEKVFM
ncbi:hypothetical protein EYF80_052410 [Liparis tanakae]|uniref:Uncharacterized protein n=1 Tax=Liparis tanakae TaxID=230148 RepID=A0A4Z2FAM0_9TELE|nr:hypothetical protein EYF80_052410 [Liparis tanakae]